MIEYGYINEGGYLVSRILEKKKELYKDKNGKLRERTVTIQKQIKMLSAGGWKPVDAIDEDQMLCEENESVHLAPYYDAGDHIAYRYEKHFDRQGVKRKIAGFKKNLADSDYKIIKSYESSLAGLDMPYDISTLHQERQLVRDEIDRLEKLFPG